MAATVVPRWALHGKAELDSPYWAPNSSLVTGDVGHSVHCPAGESRCGVSQGSYADGFDSGMSFGNGIVLEGGKGYSLRLVLKGAPTDLQATIAGSGGAQIFTHDICPATGIPCGQPQWATTTINFTAKATDQNATLSITSRSGEWWLGSVSLTPTVSRAMTAGIWVAFF